MGRRRPGRRFLTRSPGRKASFRGIRTPNHGRAGLSRLECHRPAAAGSARRHAGGAGRGRQSVLRPCRGPRRPPAGRGGARAGGGAGRGRAAERRLHLRRDRGERRWRCRRGRQPASGCWSRRSSIPRCARAAASPRDRGSAGHAARTDRSRARWSGGWRSAAAAGRWSRSCWPTTRPGSSSRSRRRPRSCMRRAALLHTDAVQAAGKIPCDIDGAGRRSALAFRPQARRPQGHRRADPARRRDCRSSRLIKGGGQERGARAGTENVAAIAGFGAAAAAAQTRSKRTAAGWRLCASGWRRASTRLRPTSSSSAPMSRGCPIRRLFAVPGMKAETAVIAFDLDGVAVSSGAACSSGKVAPSHVLAAMGVGPALARGAVRVSLGWSAPANSRWIASSHAWRKVREHYLRSHRALPLEAPEEGDLRAADFDHNRQSNPRSLKP